MPSAVRSYLTTGVALMGAGFVTAAQITPSLQQAETRVVQAAITLAAAVGNGLPCSGYNTEGCDINAPQTYVPQVLDQSGNAANIAANIVNAVADIPRAVVDALNEFSYALEVTGNWWVYSPTNVLGFDPADPPKITALVDLMIPLKPVSHAVGEHLAWWAKSNLVMDSGCTGTTGPTCPDFNSLAGKMFLAPIWKLAAGYQFGQVINPVSDAEAYIGEPIPGSVGTETAWSNAYVKLNLFDPAIALANYLLADPVTNQPKPISGPEVAATLDRLGKALWLAFNPIVPRSFLLKGWPYTILTPLFKPLVPLMCPTCNPLDPGGPPITPGSGAATTTLVSAETPAASTESAAPAVETTSNGSADKVTTTDSAEPGSATSLSADRKAAVTAVTDSPAADSTKSTAGADTTADTKKADEATGAADAAPSAPVSKPTRAGHLGSRASTAGSDQGGSPGTARARSAASAE
ncbi:MAG: hypothetical protein U0R66_05780 [Mycobacterium sp.]